MWANAQRDGRPAEYRWRPLFNAATFGWRPLLECRAVTLPRRKTRWNLQGCPKLANRSQPLVGRSSPYYDDVWRRYRCLTSFFQLSIDALAAKIQPDKVGRWCQNGDFFASCKGDITTFNSKGVNDADCVDNDDDDKNTCLLWPPHSFYLSFFFLSFLPYLISAAGDWMSTILPYRLIR